jgi:hypothetical protein
MKRVLSAATIICVLVGFSSCEKRDYTCRCKVSDGTTTEKWIGFMPNNQAQKECNDFQLSQATNTKGLAYACKTTY